MWDYLTIRIKLRAGLIKNKITRIITITKTIIPKK